MAFEQVSRSGKRGIDGEKGSKGGSDSHGDPGENGLNGSSIFTFFYLIYVNNTFKETMGCMEILAVASTLCSLVLHPNYC
jgi:hypothetical protein